MVDNLDLQQIASNLSRYCYSEESKNIISRIELIDNKKDILILQNRILEIHSLLEKKELTLNYVENINDITQSKDLKLNLDSLVRLSKYIKQSLFYCKQFKNNEKFLIFKLDRYKDLDRLSKQIDEVVSSNGELNYKHPKLASALLNLEKAKDKRTQTSRNLLVKYANIRENSVPLTNNDREVLSINYGSAARLDGIIVGSSKSGKTALFEPKELIEKNNAVVLKTQELENEISKLINNLYSRVKVEIDVIRSLDKSIQEILVIIAKARYALENKLNKVTISTDGTYKIFGARHPLIKNAVPISINIENSTKAIVISGPNAGGKTVSLKTIALTSLLLRYTGLTICEGKSIVPLYSKILFDIGDDQSILLAQSTFSSHLINIANILKESDENTLILLDELCSGTSNSEAVALSKAIIEEAIKRSSLVCVTTHLDELKLYAYNHQLYKSIATSYDTDNKKNTYQLLDNYLGESHALLLASHFLPKNLVDMANKFLSKEDKSILDLLESLEKERDKYSKISSEIDVLRSDLAKQKDRYKNKVERLNKEIHSLKEDNIRDLTEYKEKIKKIAKNNIIEAQTLLNKKIEYNRNELSNIKDKLYVQDFKKENLKVGMYVMLKGQNTTFKLLEIDKNNYVLSNESFKIRVKFNDIQTIVNKEKSEKKISCAINIPMSTKPPSMVLDLRGYYVKDALEVIEKQIEDSLMHNLDSFSIIHGLGEGRLSQGITKFLDTCTSVKSFNFARPEDGGYGKTYVYLK